MKKLLSTTLLTGSLALSLSAGTLEECVQAYQAGALDKAESLCTQATKEDSKSFLANLVLCKTYLGNGEYKKMLLVAQKLEKLAKTLVEYRLSYNLQGVAYGYLGDEKQNLNYSLKALEADKKIGDRGDIGTSLHNLGEYYRKAENYEEAKRYFNEALEYKTNKVSLAATYNSLAILYDDQKKVEGDIQAIKHFQKAIQYAKEGGDFVGSARHSVGLATEYRRLARYSDAKALIDDALQIARDRGDKSLESYALRNLGNLALVQNDKTTAKKYLNQALAIAKATGNSFEVQQAESLLQQVSR